jgi:hypothetical protein
MQQFASRDLMVSTLPEQSADVWGDEAQECGNCTDCTNNTRTERQKPKPHPKPKPKMSGQFAGDDDFAALQNQLRASRD